MTHTFQKLDSLTRERDEDNSRCSTISVIIANLNIKLMTVTEGDRDGVDQIVNFNKNYRGIKTIVSISQRVIVI